MWTACQTQDRFNTESWTTFFELKSLHGEILPAGSLVYHGSWLMLPHSTSKKTFQDISVMQSTLHSVRRLVHWNYRCVLFPWHSAKWTHQARTCVWSAVERSAGLQVRGQYLLYVVGHVVWGDALLEGALYRSCWDRETRVTTTVQTVCRLFNFSHTHFTAGSTSCRSNKARSMHEMCMQQLTETSVFFKAIYTIMKNSTKSKNIANYLTYCAHKSWHTNH